MYFFLSLFFHAVGLSTNQGSVEDTQLKRRTTESNHSPEKPRKLKVCLRCGRLTVSFFTVSHAEKIVQGIYLLIRSIFKLHSL